MAGSLTQAGATGTVTQYEPPDFSVEVRLTESAKRYLLERGETVIVSASFGDVIGPDGNYLGSIRRETALGGTVAFKGIKFAQKRIQALTTPDYEILINVFSGRRSSQSNILSCGVVQERISTLQHKSISIECALGAWAPK
jgi:hypothetical protein